MHLFLMKEPKIRDGSNLTLYIVAVIIIVHFLVGFMHHNDKKTKNNM